MTSTQTPNLHQPVPEQPGAPPGRTARNARTLLAMDLALLAAFVIALVLMAVAWTIDREAGLLLQQAEALPSLDAATLKHQAEELIQRAARWKEISGTVAAVSMLAGVAVTDRHSGFGARGVTRDGSP